MKGLLLNSETLQLARVRQEPQVAYFTKQDGPSINHKHFYLAKLLRRALLFG